MELKINKEIETYIQRLNDEQFGRLKNSIQKDGLLTPIETMADGTIVDGHHRYKACKELGIEVQTRILPLIKTVEDAIDYTYRVNIMRRQMNTYQLVEWAMRKRFLEEGKAAKKRMKVTSNDVTSIGEVCDLIGKELGIGPTTFTRARKVFDEAPETVKEKLRQEEWTINYAYQGYQTLEKVTDKNMKKQLKENFEGERITPAQLIKIVGLTNIAEEEIGNTTETIAEKVREKFGSQFWTEGLDIKELEHSIRELEGAPQELKTIEIETARFGSKDEAEKFFKKCGGHLSGLKSYYIGKVDPLKYKPMETKEEE